jgi:hypothetical protein
MVDTLTPWTKARLIDGDQPAARTAPLKLGARASDEARYDALAFAAEAAAVARDAAFLCTSLEHMSTLADRRFSTPTQTPKR